MQPTKDPTPRAPVADVYGGTAEQPSIDRGYYRIEWTNLREGRHGEYDAKDPSDVNVLRFDIIYLEGGFEPTHLDHGSYATTVPASTPPAVLKAMLAHMMDRLIAYTGSAIAQDRRPYVKFIAEKLSRMRPEDVPGVFRCPQTPGTLIGCGSLFTAENDKDGFVDCAVCDLRFHAAIERLEQ